MVIAVVLVSLALVQAVVIRRHTGYDVEVELAYSISITVDNTRHRQYVLYTGLRTYCTVQYSTVHSVLYTVQYATKGNVQYY